jgi:outer membrane protein OmpA-like peptidoglycan-associated protein
MKKFTLLVSIIFLVSSSIFAQNGLKADYYDGINFDRLVGTQIEANIDYYWNYEAPFPEMNPNECSVRWTGRLMSPKTGEFKFSARVDDGIRVWVGGVQVIDNWQLNDVGYSSGNVILKEGEYYDIVIEYFNALREAEIKFYWTLPKPKDMSWYDNFWYDDEEETVPAKYFFQPFEPEIVAVEEKEIVLPKPEKQTPKKKPIVPVKPKVTKAIVIEDYIPKNVQFAQAKTEILPESFAELDRLAVYLVDNPAYKIKIEGHTDNVGDAAKNLTLSHSRARAVAAYLIKKGVNHERLSAEGFGGSKPLVKSDGRKYHPENRRVEFIVE